jgi:preprotein translocase subunit SecF
MVMTKTRLTFGFIVVIAVVGAAMLLSIDTAMNVYAQNTTMPPVTAQQNQTADPQQIKNYLTQAIQALDSGNNTKAAEQVGLAEDQLEGMTGTESAEDDEDEEIEEGAGEDADEPGDIDTNDEEDAP